MRTCSVRLFVCLYIYSIYVCINIYVLLEAQNFLIEYVATLQRWVDDFYLSDLICIYIK